MHTKYEGKIKLNPLLYEELMDPPVTLIRLPLQRKQTWLHINRVIEVRNPPPKLFLGGKLAVAPYPPGFL